jgi:hypothetical protein
VIVAPQPSFYGGEGRGSLKTFCRTCEQQFRVNRDLYYDDSKKITLAQGFLTGEVADAWERRTQNEEQTEMTWEQFKGFLLDELSPATLRGIDVGQKWNEARQGPNQSVKAFATYLDQLYDMMTTDQPEASRCDKLLYGLRPEIFNILIERREGQNKSRSELLNCAVLAEASLRRPGRSTLPLADGRDRLIQPRPRAGRVRPEAPPYQARNRITRTPASGSNLLKEGRQKPTCGYCGIKGHTTEACFRKENAEKANETSEHPKGPTQ